MLQIARVVNCKCYKLRVAHIVNCTCCELHMLQIARVTNDMCCQVAKVQTSNLVMHVCTDRQTDPRTGGLLELLSQIKICFFCIFLFIFKNYEGREGLTFIHKNISSVMNHPLFSFFDNSSPDLLIKTQQSGICPAQCVLRQCTVPCPHSNISLISLDLNVLRFFQ